jgi:hypothetical protein
MEDQSGSGTSAFHAIVGRALVDADFRSELRDRSKRDALLETMGVSADQRRSVSGELDEAIDAVGDLAEALGDIRAAS